MLPVQSSREVLEIELGSTAERMRMRVRVRVPAPSDQGEGAETDAPHTHEQKRQDRLLAHSSAAASSSSSSPTSASSASAQSASASASATPLSVHADVDPWGDPVQHLYAFKKVITIRRSVLVCFVRFETPPPTPTNPLPTQNACTPFKTFVHA